MGIDCSWRLREAGTAGVTPESPGVLTDCHSHAPSLVCLVFRRQEGNPRAGARLESLPEEGRQAMLFWPLALLRWRDVPPVLPCHQFQTGTCLLSGVSLGSVAVPSGRHYQLAPHSSPMLFGFVLSRVHMRQRQKSFFIFESTNW